MDDYLGVRRGERETLEGFLDWYRAVVERKVDGLSLDDATRVMTPTGMSALGILKHLGWVERGWFRETFAGEDVEAIDVDGDNSAEFAIDHEDTVASVVAFYRAEVEQSRRVVHDTPSLDAVSATETNYGEYVSLRWIVVHMLEETARHAGHLDLIRERIDGQVGD
ncbi:MAG: DinB family protein [Acidimicrobiales bacterium]